MKRTLTLVTLLFAAFLATSCTTSPAGVWITTARGDCTSLDAHGNCHRPLYVWPGWKPSGRGTYPNETGMLSDVKHHGFDFHRPHLPTLGIAAPHAYASVSKPEPSPADSTPPQAPSADASRIATVCVPGENWIDRSLNAASCQLSQQHPARARMHFRIALVKIWIERALGLMKSYEANWAAGSARYGIAYSLQKVCGADGKCEQVRY